MTLGRLSIPFRYRGLAPWPKDPQGKISPKVRNSQFWSLLPRFASRWDAIVSYTVLSFLSVLHPMIEAIRYWLEHMQCLVCHNLRELWKAVRNHEIPVIDNLSKEFGQYVSTVMVNVTVSDDWSIPL